MVKKNLNVNVVQHHFNGFLNKKGENMFIFGYTILIAFLVLNKFKEI